jgi:hypothetical protein
LEEQLIDDLIYRFTLNQDQFLRGEYNSDTSHLDGEDLPHGIQLIYNNGGPQYSVEKYLPIWHYDNTIEHLQDSYEALLDFTDE